MSLGKTWFYHIHNQGAWFQNAKLYHLLRNRQIDVTKAMFVFLWRILLYPVYQTNPCICYINRKRNIRDFFLQISLFFLENYKTIIPRPLTLLIIKDLSNSPSINYKIFQYQNKQTNICHETGDTLVNLLSIVENMYNNVKCTGM